MFFKKKKNNKQTTYCYCTCGRKSAWDFYAPAPLLIEVDGISTI